MHCTLRQDDDEDDDDGLTLHMKQYTFSIATCEF
jgi:hypothetical protein